MILRMNNYLKPILITSFIAILISLAITFMTHPVLAESDANVLIIEVQTTGASSAKDEFVELYNTQFAELSVKGWEVQYKAAAGKKWIKRAELSGAIPPRGSMLVSSTNGDSKLTPGMSYAGGSIRIVDQKGVEKDYVAWGSVALNQGSAAKAPKAGDSLKRVLNDNDNYAFAGSSANNYAVSGSPTPYSDVQSWLSEKPIQECRVAPPSKVASPPTKKQSSAIIPKNVSTNRPTIYPTVLLSEFLPDPEKPQTDSNNEYVELRNPSNKMIDIEGFVLETGGSSQVKQVLRGTIAANSYTYITSGDANISLINNGGTVRLLRPDGALVASIDYPKAVPGQTWAELNGSWAWGTPTPGKGNVHAAKSRQPLNAAPRKQSNNTTAVSVQSNELASKIEGSTEEDKGVITQDTIQDNSDNEPSQWPTLAGMGSLGLLYAGYERRNDLRDFIIRRRTNL